jgi:hypothetical protein
MAFSLSKLLSDEYDVNGMIFQPHTLSAFDHMRPRKEGRDQDYWLKPYFSHEAGRTSTVVKGVLGVSRARLAHPHNVHNTGVDDLRTMFQILRYDRYLDVHRGYHVSEHPIVTDQPDHTVVFYIASALPIASEVFNL